MAPKWLALVSMMTIVLGDIGPFRDEAGQPRESGLPPTIANGTLYLTTAAPESKLVLADGATYPVTLVFSDDQRQFVARATVDRIRVGWAIDMARPTVATLLVHSRDQGVLRAAQIITSLSAPVW